VKDQKLPVLRPPPIGAATRAIRISARPGAFPGVTRGVHPSNVPRKLVDHAPYAGFRHGRRDQRAFPAFAPRGPRARPPPVASEPCLPNGLRLRRPPDAHGEWWVRVRRSRSPRATISEPAVPSDPLERRVRTSMTHQRPRPPPPRLPRECTGWWARNMGVAARQAPQGPPERHPQEYIARPCTVNVYPPRKASLPAPSPTCFRWVGGRKTMSVIHFDAQAITCAKRGRAARGQEVAFTFFAKALRIRGGAPSGPRRARTLTPFAPRALSFLSFAGYTDLFEEAAKFRARAARLWGPPPAVREKIQCRRIGLPPCPVPPQYRRRARSAAQQPGTKRPRAGGVCRAFGCCWGGTQSLHTNRGTTMALALPTPRRSATGGLACWRTQQFSAHETGGARVRPTHWPAAGTSNSLNRTAIRARTRCVARGHSATRRRRPRAPSSRLVPAAMRQSAYQQRRGGAPAARGCGVRESFFRRRLPGRLPRRATPDYQTLA